MPKPYPGPLTLLRAYGGFQYYMSDPFGGWGDLVSSEIELYDLVGDHISVITTEGLNWGPLLSSLLAKARRAAATGAGKSRPTKARKSPLPDSTRRLVEARAACKRGDLKGEIAAYQRAGAATLPRWALRNLGEALIQSGAIDAGVAKLREAIAIDPWPCNAFTTLADTLVKLKRPEGLEALYGQARAIVPEDSDALFDFAHLCSLVGRSAEAEVVLRRSLALDLQRTHSHQSRGSKYIYLAEILAHQGRLEEATATARLAVDFDPKSAENAARLGMLIERAGRKNEAANWYRRSLMLEPGNTGVQGRLNNVLRLA